MKCFHGFVACALLGIFVVFSGCSHSQIHTIEKDQIGATAKITRINGLWVHRGVGLGTYENLKIEINPGVCVLVIVIDGDITETTQNILKEYDKQDGVCLLGSKIIVDDQDLFNDEIERN